MKLILSYEAELFEDDDSIKVVVHAFDMLSAIDDARNIIRSRLKWGEGVSDKEEKILEEIREALWIEGLDQ